MASFSWGFMSVWVKLESSLWPPRPHTIDQPLSFPSTFLPSPSPAPCTYFAPNALPSDTHTTPALPFLTSALTSSPESGLPWPPALYNSITCLQKLETTPCYLLCVPSFTVFHTHSLFWTYYIHFVSLLSSLSQCKPHEDLHLFCLLLTSQLPEQCRNKTGAQEVFV